MGILSKLKPKPKKVYSAVLQNDGREFPVKEKQSVLSAALNAGIDFPYSCQAGSCTTCKCLLLEGEYLALSDMSLILTEEERKRGFVLACQTVPRSDLIVALEEDESEEFAGKITSIEKLTHDIIELKVAIPEKSKYKAGQYANLTVPDRIAPRSYSMASPAGSKELQFFIRKTPGGEFSEWLFGEAKKNQILQVRSPFGSFYLREGNDPIIAIAGGSGLAPILAIFKEAAGKIKRDVTFLFGVREQRDLYCVSEIEAIAAKWKGQFNFVPVLSHEKPDSKWKGARGLVTEFIAQANLSSESQAYLCGPPVMIDAAIPILKEKGIQGSNIFFDKFTDRSHLSQNK